MKYVILKSSALLCFQFAEQNGNPLQIFCFDRKEDFNNYLEENEADVHGLPATDKIASESPVKTLKFRLSTSAVCRPIRKS